MLPAPLGPFGSCGGRGTLGALPHSLDRMLSQEFIKEGMVMSTRKCVRYFAIVGPYTNYSTSCLILHLGFDPNPVVDGLYHIEVAETMEHTTHGSLRGGMGD